MSKGGLTHTDPVAACRAIAEAVAAAAAAMGLAVARDRSQHSASHYLRVHDPASTDAEPVVVRCSDHPNRTARRGRPRGSERIEARLGDCPSTAVARLAARFGRPVPAGFSTTDFRRQRDADLAAARQASLDKIADDRSITEAVAAELAYRDRRTRAAAGRLIDVHAPGLPAGRRRRLAETALRIAGRAVSTGE